MPGNSPETYRVLIYGRDARSDALATISARSTRQHELYAYSQFRNPGFINKCIDVTTGSLTDTAQMIRYALKVRPHLAIVGPEEPLAVGLVDALEELGIPCFGPNQSLAKVETSKAWTRRLLQKYRIPGNPEHRIFATTTGLPEYIKELSDFVLKPDGLTGGKGVRVSGEHIDSISSALEYAKELLATAPCFLVEERLEGEEFSLQTICDGQHFVHSPVAQDHKRAFDGDTGPNTGGMGSYSCADHSLPFLTEVDIAEAKAITEAVGVALLEETGKPYRGVLYGGFMATRHGVKLLEYNARFADPEAMNILPLLETDFLDLCESVTRGELHNVPLTFLRRATVCKYVVPRGYPTRPLSGARIVVPDQLLRRTDLQVYFAAVDQKDSKLLLTGSRAVALLGIANTLQEAERLAEFGAQSIEGPVVHRRDIGTQALIQARVDHMVQLRSEALSTPTALNPRPNPSPHTPAANSASS